MKLSEIATILMKVAEVFPNQQISETAVKVWHELFKNLDVMVFHNALLTVAKQPGCRFFPSPGDVQAVLNRAAEQQNATPDEAWKMVCDYASQGCVGEFKGDKFALAAAEQIGWRVLRYESFENLKFVRNRFEKIYTGFLEREQFQNLAIGFNNTKQIGV